MDIRVSSYSPLTVQSFGKAGNLPAVTTVQNAAQSSPVQPVTAVQGGAASQGARIADTFDGKGRLVDIYA